MYISRLITHMDWVANNLKDYIHKALSNGEHGTDEA